MLVTSAQEQVSGQKEVTDKRSKDPDAIGAISGKTQWPENVPLEASIMRLVK